MRQCQLMLLFLLLGPAVQAQNFEALVDPAASSSTFEFDSELQNSGTLSGDFDPDSNPTGTQTRLGLFGGSGNMPIPISLDLLSASGGSASPEGVFGLALDIPALSGTLSGLALDLAPGSPFSTDASARLVYETFRTVSPTCTYVSVGPVTLPIGEIGQIRDITLVQTEPASLQIESTPDPDRFTVQAEVPALLSLVIDTSFADDPLPLSDLPVLLPLSGSLERTAPDRFEFQAVLAPQILEGSLDLGGAALPPIPLAFPCVFPQGSPDANLILSVGADALEFELEFGFELVAEAIKQTFTDPIFSDRFE
jgi:hypothetical protein